MRELLDSSAEKLAEDSLFDVLVFPDAWGKGSDQLVIDSVLVLRDPEELGLEILGEVDLVVDSEIGGILLQGVTGVCLFVEGDDVEVGLENAFECPVFDSDSPALCSVDSGDFDPVAWFDCVDVIIVSDEGEGLGGFPIRDILRHFLQLHDLLVHEEAEIVDDFKGVLGPAFRAVHWLHDPPPLDRHCLRLPAVLALEHCVLHFRRNVRTPNHDPPQTY